MAVRIKQISCPVCGSNKKTNETPPNRFRCKSCGSEYIVDDDNNITITHRHEYVHINKDDGTTPMAPEVRKRMIILSLCLSAGMIFMVLWANFSNFSGSSSVFDSDHWVIGDSRNEIVRGRDQRPLYLVMGARKTDKSKDKKHFIYLGYYDALDKGTKEIALVNTNLVFDGDSRDRLSTDRYCGKLYLISRKLLLRAEPERLSFTDLTPRLLSQFSQLSSGIAEMSGHSDAISIITNDGASYDYYPEANFLIHKDSVSEQERTLHPQADKSEKTFYTMLSRDGSIRGPRELWQYKATFDPRYPYSVWILHSTLGIRDLLQNIGKPREKELLKPYFMSSLSPITPGRRYYEARVLDYDNSRILISYNPTPADDDRYKIQLLSLPSGKPILTIDFPTKGGRPEEGLITAAGVLINGSNSYLYDYTGGLVSTYPPDTNN